MASSARIDELKKKFDENPRRYFAPLANEYRKAGDLDQAIFICQEYLPQQPGHMSGHIVYAQTLFEMGRHDEAKSAFEAALALDPENLIALRHLGDIARQTGDLTEARSWYERVLEADPRNEEIVEAMASLLGAPAAQTPTTSSMRAEPAEPAPPGLRTPALSFAPVETSRPSPFAPAPPVPPVPPVETDVGVDEELLDLDDMTIGGGSLSATSHVSNSGQHDADRESSQDQEAFQSDPFAPTANEPPSIELATDLNLGLIDDGSESDSTPVVDALEGLHSFEAGVLSDSVESLESDLDMKPFYDILHGDASPEAHAADSAAELSVERASEEQGPISPTEFEDLAETTPGSTPAAREPTPPVATEIFVTETMAELYLQQGHVDSALDIYRKLLEQRPNDEALLERVRYAEERLFGVAEPAVADVPAEVTSPDASGYATPEGQEAAQTGPTIREFLVGLIAGRSALPAASGENGQSGQPGGSMSRATLPGSIDALFPGTGTSSTDSTAATALAGAFGMMDDLDVDVSGASTYSAPDQTPSHPADGGKTPLATDAVADGFSFDQFFSGEATAPAAKPPVDAAKPPVESPEDIAQFNAWLSGLKKT